MRALVVSQSKLQIREVADPEPRSDEVLVNVKAFSLNRGEVRGVASASDGTVPGWDVAGVDDEGRRVVGIVRKGAWAEKVAVRRTAMGELPDGVTFEDAATLPVAGLTALRALQYASPLLGKRVCITGASGGVGMFAMQLAGLGGAQARGVRALENANEQFDVILDSVGGTSLANALHSVAPGGIVVSFGNSANEPTTFDVRPFFLRGRATLRGLIIFDEVEHEPFAPRGLAYLASLVGSGALKTEIASVRNWDEVQTSIDELRDRKMTGKAVLRIG